MRISLDYDGTFTEDPKFWTEFIGLAKTFGHEVVCISSRFPSNPPVGVPAEIICCSFTAKSKTTWADVWIDDHPWSIHLDYPRGAKGEILPMNFEQKKAS